MIPLSLPLQHLVDHLSKNGVSPVFVGGFVRDHLIGKASFDLDIELYGLDSLQQLHTLLRSFGPLNEVGKSFGVIKLSYAGYAIDFSTPRTESKTGQTHRDFTVTTYHTLDFSTAAKRRDFTINAIGYDPLTQAYLDPYNGIEDLRSRLLRCVDSGTFVEDPLRILRAVQFAARFELRCDDALLQLCRKMVSEGALEHLPKERIFEEIKKLLLLSSRPSIGLELLSQMDALYLFSPMEHFASTPQDPLSHPEGDLWTHTLMCIDTMAGYRSGDDQHDLILMLAALLHDIGKPETTVIENGWVNAPKHASAGVPVAEAVLRRLTDHQRLIDAILPLIQYHGFPRKLFKCRADDAALRHLSTKVNIADLITLARADFYGRSFNEEIPKRFEAGEWLYEKADALKILHAPPQPLLLGRDLVALGLTPSPKFKILLENAYNAQLDGIFSTHDDAIKWIKKELSNILVIYM